MANISKFIVLGLILIIGISVFYIFFGTGSQNLDVSLTAADEVMAGVPFNFKVEFSNQLNTVLKNVALIVTLPEGAVFVGSGEEKLVDSKSLGDIGSGSLISQDYKIIFLKGVGESHAIKALVSYTSGPSKYEKEKIKSIKLANTGIDFDFKAPEKVFAGEEFELNINYKNISDSNFSGLQLSIDYPANFTFISSDSKPDTNNNTWDLGDLRSGSESKFAIKGSAVGPDNSPVVFRSKLQFRTDGRSYVLDLKDVNLVISPSPLSLGVVLNDKSDYAAVLSDDLKYVITYINNTDVPLRDVVVRAQLTGELFDLTTLDTKAIFRSSDNTLIWNSSNSPELNYIAPRSAGFVNFFVKTKSNYPIRRLGDKDFILVVKTEIESPTVPEFLNTNRTYNVSKLETKVTGNLSLAEKVYFRDALSGILNKGLMPPKVGEPTDFTVHWIIKSLATDFSNIEIRAPLMEGIKFTGTAKTNYGNAPIYDASKNEVVWILEKLPANKGFVDDPAEAIFQIEAIPPSSRAGNYMPLLGEVAIKAIDVFTLRQIELKLNQVTTALPDDLTIGQQGGVVQP